MIGSLIQPEFDDMIARQAWPELREAILGLEPVDAADLLIDLPAETKGIVFRVLPKDRAAMVFAYLPLERQQELVDALSGEQIRGLVEQMTDSDRARLLDELPPDVTRRLMEGLSPERLGATRVILGYPPESAGRFMTPAYVRLRPGMTAREALEHARTCGHREQVISTMYVIDEQGRLIDEVSLATLVLADPGARLCDLKEAGLMAIPISAGRDVVVWMFARYGRTSLPVVDSDGSMLGVITADDVLEAAQAKATESIQRIGGTEALDSPYFVTCFRDMMKKRGGWLSALFLGEMLTATAMGFFSGEIEKAVVLALFVPLIISSGGNSGSQAATIIIRALALGEVTLRDWWRIMRRELLSGLTLGAWLGTIGFLRIALWQLLGWGDYTEHWLLVAVTVWISLVGVVTFGTLSGSLLPLLMRRLGFDPATSSAPFVATLVDVTGLIIFFGTAFFVLRGTLL